MSDEPFETVSMPAEEPNPETRTFLSGLCSWNFSPAISAIGRIVVDPVTTISKADVSVREQPDPVSATAGTRHTHAMRRARVRVRGARWIVFGSKSRFVIYVYSPSMITASAPCLPVTGAARYE